MTVTPADFRSYPDCGLDWLDPGGDDADIVLSTRVRLARNIQGHRFVAHAAVSELGNVLEKYLRAVSDSRAFAAGLAFEIDRMDSVTQRVLLERRLVSKELIGGSEEARVLHLASGAPVSVMVNEEDHLRLQSITSGFRVGRAWMAVDRLDDELGGALPFAFDSEFGYLTACPTNVGTGMRASVFMHLPGLVLTREIGKVLKGLMEVGVAFRGLYGEGSEVIGNFFQISNERTLGKNEEDLLADLEGRVRHVIRCERDAREILLRDARSITEDKVWRAFGLLRHARALEFEELMSLLSGVRLGVSLELLPPIGVYTLNKMMILTQPAHLEYSAGSGLKRSRMEAECASYVRAALAADLNGDSQGQGDRRPSR
ncbi:MAG: protein arginine kinase [Gemmatimonadetes bacterium]|nr:protein arginine kinase [Gemmatimonadota bacterium]